MTRCICYRLLNVFLNPLHYILHDLKNKISENNFKKFVYLIKNNKHKFVEKKFIQMKSFLSQLAMILGFEVTTSQVARWYF